MADEYRPGDFWRIDERTGFKVRASQTRKEWTGAIVRDESWEARHPQDFVRGRRDRQSVPDPRPRPADLSQGPTTTYTTAASSAGQTFVVVESVAGLGLDNVVSVVLSNGDVFLTTILAIFGLTVYLDGTLPGDVASGTAVVDYEYSTIVQNEINYDFSDARNSHHLPFV